MTITATITPNCKYLSLVVTGPTGGADITITNGENNTLSLPINIPASGTINQLIHLETQLGVENGVFRVSGLDVNGVEAWAGALGSCSLDCCIAKKVDTILECGCGCTKCNEALRQAERVLLLISGINADLAQLSNVEADNAAIYQTAETKYKKALELCSDSCGCNC